jgi:hypothetical protein
MQIARVENMVNMEAKTLNEIHKQGIEALVKVPGPVDAVRFLQIYDPGSGDYTKDEKTMA